MTSSEHASFPARLLELLMRRRAAVLLVAALLTMAAWPFAARLRLDESIQSFYAPDDPDLQAWLDSKDWFGGDEFVMIAYRDAALLSERHPDRLSAVHLRELQEFADQFRDPQSVPGVVHTETRDLGSTLNFRDAPAFENASRLERAIMARFFENSLLEFSRNLLIGSREEALCPRQFGPWRRTLLTASPLAEFISQFSSGNAADARGDVTGIHATYESGAGQFSVFTAGVSSREQADAVDALLNAVQLADGAVLSDLEAEHGIPFSVPAGAGAGAGLISAGDDRLYVFIGRGAGLDLEAARADFFAAAKLESDATAVMLRLESQSDEERRETLARIRELAAAHDPPAHVAGEPVQIHDMFRYVEDDAATLGWATSGMLMFVILVLFRSLRWVLLPLAVVHATIIWTKALLVIANLRLSMVSSMLTSLVTIIGIATVMHVTVTFRELRGDRDRESAFRETFLRLAPAVFWTCVTTAIGFLALLSSEIVPVRSFGIMVALGSLLVLATSALILPGGILIGRHDADPRRTPAEGTLVRMLLGVTRWVERRPAMILLGTMLIVLFAALGLTRIRVETDFSKNFRADSDIARSIEFFESNLGGAGNWEVNFPAPAELDEAFLDKVRALAAELRMIEMQDGTRLTKVYALTDGLGFIPAQMGDTIDERLAALRDFQPDFEKQLYNPAAGRMRLFLRSHEQRPAEIKLALIDEVERRSRAVFPESRTTGIYVLIANLITSLLNDQLTSFLWAALGIGLAMAIAFRNVWIGLAGLVPNAFPILVVIGGMGWLDVPLNIGTAMIACVSMGLTVDSSIHYLTGYRRARQNGADHAGALREAHAGVGRALVFANVALIAGFSVLTLSHFIPLVYFGVLVSVAMLGGLIGNLVLLPILLRWVPMRI